MTTEKWKIAWSEKPTRLVSECCEDRKKELHLYSHLHSGLPLPTWPCRTVVLPPLPHFAEPTWVPSGPALCPRAPHSLSGLPASCLRSGRRGGGVFTVMWLGDRHFFPSLTLKGVQYRGRLYFCPLTPGRKRLMWL